METDNEIELFTQWVSPIYMNMIRGLRNMRFHDLDLEQIGKLLAEIDDDTLMQLLASKNWRMHHTAAWFVGLGKLTEFTEQVGVNLLMHPPEAQPYCFALARLGVAVPPQYLSDYLSKYLTQERVSSYDLERYPVGDALAALQLTSPEAIEPFFPELWNQVTGAYISRFEGTSISTDELQLRWNFDQIRLRFASRMEFVAQHFD